MLAFPSFSGRRVRVLLRRARWRWLRVGIALARRVYMQSWNLQHFVTTDRRTDHLRYGGLMAVFRVLVGGRACTLSPQRMHSGLRAALPQQIIQCDFVVGRADGEQDSCIVNGKHTKSRAPLPLASSLRNDSISEDVQARQNAGRTFRGMAHHCDL